MSATTFVCVHKNVDICVSVEGVFRAVVGPRGKVVEAETLAKAKVEIDSILEELAGEQRKDVKIPCRILIGDTVKSVLYLGLRAIKHGSKHAFKTVDTGEVIYADDFYADGVKVLPDSVGTDALAEFDMAVENVKLAMDRLHAARKALRTSRAPWVSNIPDRTNSDRVKEQARFVKELTAILSRTTPSNTH